MTRLGLSRRRRSENARFFSGLGACLLWLSWVASCYSDKHDENASVHQRTKDQVQVEPLPELKGACGAFCQARLDQRRQRHGGDYMSNSDLFSWCKTRDKVIADLKIKYGDTTFSRVFESSHGKLRETFVTPKIRAGRQFSGSNENYK
jgi:hypothetical protein